MIYTFREQLQMAFYFILLGIFTSIMIDICTCIRFKNKIITYLVQIIFWIGVCLIMMKAVMKVSNGYIPIYIFLFFIIGFIIYKYCLRNELLKTLKRLKTYNSKYRKQVKTVLLPKEFWEFIMKVIKRLWKKLFKKQKKVDETP